MIDTGLMTYSRVWFTFSYPVLFFSFFNRTKNFYQRSFLVKSISIVQLHQISEIKEWQKKAQTFPHPRVEAIDCDVHLLPLSQRPQSVETTLLVHILKILQECHVHVEQHVLVPEVSVAWTVRPNKENSTNNTRDEVVGPPPSLDARTIDYQNGLSKQKNIQRLDNVVISFVVNNAQFTGCKWLECVNFPNPSQLKLNT